MRDASVIDELRDIVFDMEHEIDSVKCCALLLNDYLTESVDSTDSERLNAHCMITGHLLGLAHKLNEQHLRMFKLVNDMKRGRAA